MSASNIRVLNKYIKYKNQARETIQKQRMSESMYETPGFLKSKNKTRRLKNLLPIHKK